LAAGAREGVAVGTTFFLAFLGVGSVYRLAALDALQAAVSTLLLMSGPAQVALVDTVRDHQSLAALLLATCVINGRYFVMSAVLAPAFRHVSLLRLLPPWTFLSTTTFASTYAALRRPELATHPLAYFLGLSAVSIPAAIFGTLAGYYGAGLLPDPLRATVDMILPIYFVILLAREWPKALPLLAGGLGFVLTPILERIAPGLGMLLASLVVGIGLGLVKPGGEERKHGDE
jgi:predicted branched-subunit amino acid permease